MGDFMGKYMGIDIGSSASKALVLDDSAAVIARAIVAKGTGTRGVAQAVAEIEAQLSAGLSDLDYIVATGYGRNTFEAADQQISELSCHALGVHTVMPRVRTIIDIGGQDVKALSLDENGNLVNFIMNEKCAAGTGRFLEVMAGVLEIGLADMGPLSLTARDIASVSSTCTVFAESEVISRLSDGRPIADIVAGIHESVAKRVVGLAKRIDLRPDLAMSGGVAKNAGVKSALEKELRLEIFIPEDCQFMGALGAAMFARRADRRAGP